MFLYYKIAYIKQFDSHTLKYFCGVLKKTHTFHRRVFLQDSPHPPTVAPSQGRVPWVREVDGKLLCRVLFFNSPLFLSLYVEPFNRLLNKLYSIASLKEKHERRNKTLVCPIFRSCYRLKSCPYLYL